MEQRRNAPARHSAEARAVIYGITVVALLAASLAFGEERPPEKASPPALRLSPERLARHLGLDPGLTREALAVLAGDGQDGKGAALVIILAKEWTDQRVRAGEIKKEDVPRAFRESVESFLKEYKRAPNWNRLASQVGLKVPDLTRRASAAVREAESPDIGPTAPESGQKIPKEIADKLAKRFRLPDGALEKAWGQLAGFSPKRAVMLLILAGARTDRFLDTGAIGEREVEETFLQSLQLFVSQLRREVGWGDLAVQVGLHANELNRQANLILGKAKAPAEQREDR
jgi:hypothetical protein